MPKQKSPLACDREHPETKKLRKALKKLSLTALSVQFGIPYEWLRSFERSKGTNINRVLYLRDRLADVGSVGDAHRE